MQYWEQDNFICKIGNVFLLWNIAWVCDGVRLFTLLKEYFVPISLLDDIVLGYKYLHPLLVLFTYDESKKWRLNLF